MDSVERERERVHTFSEVGCEVFDTIQNKNNNVSINSRATYKNITT
jgi:hypothetical protein